MNRHEVIGVFVVCLLVVLIVDDCDRVIVEVVILLVPTLVVLCLVVVRVVVKVLNTRLEIVRG